MCTVTYFPLKKNDFILTSNRDVPFTRKKALYPQKYIENNVELTYPKDGNAGGTWIGTSSKNRLICLLNGGYKNHKPKQEYKKSRGIIVKELLSSDNINIELMNINLINIEPFTLVIADWNEELDLIEFVWTGDKKHLIHLPQEPHIWSSSTLYNNTVKKMRQNWFDQWKLKNELKQETILEFHKTAGNGVLKNNVLMQRENGGTVSISSIKRENNELNFLYEAIR